MTTTTAAAHDFYERVMDIILQVGELYSTDSKVYKEFYTKATRDVEFYYPIVLSGALTEKQALRYIQDLFESYLPELA